MDTIPEPKYKPNQWVQFEYGNSQAIGQVKGMSYQKDKGWLYTISNPGNPNTTMMTFEDKIFKTVSVSE